MLTVKSFERPDGANGTQMIVHSDEFMDGTAGDIRYLMVDGVLETYTSHYGYPPGVCLSVMLLDAFYDDVEAPYSGDAGAAEKFLEIAALADDRIVFECDRNALLAAITLADDDAESVAGSWRASRAATQEAARGYLRRKEELLAEEFVSGMVDDKKGVKSRVDMGVPVDSVDTRQSTFRVEW